MSLESALAKAVEQNPRLQTAWEQAAVPTAHFEVHHAIDSDTLSVCVTARETSTELHAAAGQLDPARIVGNVSAWQLWPELGLDQDEQVVVRGMLENLDYTVRRREAAEQIGHAVDLQHPRTVAMRSLTRRWATELGPQTLLEKTHKADAGASMLGSAYILPPERCIVDDATLCYLAVKPASGHKTAGVPLDATGFRNGFDLSLLLELQGVACYDPQPDTPQDYAYLGRQNFSIPLVGFDIAHPQKTDEWRIHPNYAVVTEEQEEVLRTALTSLSVWHDKGGFSAQFCGILTMREEVQKS